MAAETEEAVAQTGAVKDETLDPSQYSLEHLTRARILMEIQQMDIEMMRDQILSRKLLAEAETAEMQARHLARTEKDELASFDNHHVFTFVGEVNVKTADVAIAVLEKWHYREPECDITFVIQSPGGDVIAGFALYDYMMWLRRHGHRITTVARGIAASMAGIILQAGDERFMDPNAQMLIHELSGEIGGRLSDIGDTHTMFEKLDARGTAILAERSTLTARQIKSKMSRKDWWLSSDEAVKLGFADRVD